MSASYCGPDCVSCSARSTDEEEWHQGRNEKHARAQKDECGSGIFFVKETTPGETDRQAGRHPGTCSSSKSRSSKAAPISLRMIRWIACVHCRDWEREGGIRRMRPYGCPCALSAGCRKVRPVGIGMQIATKAITSFWSCFCCYCSYVVKCWLAAAAATILQS